MILLVLGHESPRVTFCRLSRNPDLLESYTPTSRDERLYRLSRRFPFCLWGEYTQKRRRTNALARLFKKCTQLGLKVSDRDTARGSHRVYEASVIDGKNFNKWKKCKSGLRRRFDGPLRCLLAPLLCETRFRTSEIGFFFLSNDKWISNGNRAVTRLWRVHFAAQ